MKRILTRAWSAKRWKAMQVTRLRGRTAGMSTAEYAVGILAACTFAAVLIGIVRSGGVEEALTGLITTALSVAS